MDSIILACKNAAMSAICSGVRDCGGIPLSARPCRITSPILSPLTSCATNGERTKSGPRPPVASVPWQNPHESANCLRPRSTAAESPGFRSCRACDGRITPPIATSEKTPNEVAIPLDSQADMRSLSPAPLRESILCQSTVAGDFLNRDSPYACERIIRVR